MYVWARCALWHSVLMTYPFVRFSAEIEMRITMARLSDFQSPKWSHWISTLDSTRWFSTFVPLFFRECRWDIAILGFVIRIVLILVFPWYVVCVDVLILIESDDHSQHPFAESLSWMNNNFYRKSLWWSGPCSGFNPFYIAIFAFMASRLCY